MDGNGVSIGSEAAGRGATGVVAGLVVFGGAAVVRGLGVGAGVFRAGGGARSSAANMGSGVICGSGAEALISGSVWVLAG